ncbi:hypothetical protein ACFRAE_12415 [Sphingobacterium sp. HJSM2_6]|uniref:hypothetical protein n=1 Tax=Sphingobacterium sp. HJSM2_6 TaxID=3366264 RepID=UPI003BC5693F
MKNLMVFAFVLLGLASCSKETIDSIGKDSALNIIRSNKWYDVVKIEKVGNDIVLKDTIVGNQVGHYLDFNKDGFAYVFDGEGGTKSIKYDMPTSKSMNFDGSLYTIKENILQTLLSFSMENTTNGKTTTYTFKRR